MQNAAEQGEYIMSRLKELMPKYEVIGDVRGKGLMIGIEFVRERVKKERYPELRDAVVEGCFNQGLLVLGCGPNTLRLCPPLVIDREQSAACLQIFETALKDALIKVDYKGFPF